VSCPLHCQPKYASEEGNPKKQYKKPPAKAITLGRGKRSVSPKRKSASPERKAGEKSPSKTAADRDEAAKKVERRRSLYLLCRATTTTCPSRVSSRP